MTIPVLIGATCLVVAAAVGLFVRVRRKHGSVSLAEWTASTDRARPGEIDVSVLDIAPPGPDQIVAVLFTHPECGGCEPLKRRVSSIERVVVHVVDVSVEPATAKGCGVDSVPTLVLAGADGAVVRSWVGTPLAGTLEETVRSALS